MKTAIIIPARYASTRLPGKPLLRETGRFLIQHVYERASQLENIETVLVATDDERIKDAVESFGGRAVMTRSDHATGTDRIAEAARQVEADVIINLQGDEPLIDLDSLRLLPELLAQNPSAVMATIAVPFQRLEDWQNPNNVKVVCDESGRALYFSRSPIPFVRDGAPDFTSGQYLHHQGLYAYRRSFLFQFASMRSSQVEDLEKLEQLRTLASGFEIQVGVVQEAALGVDTPEDYRRFVNMVHAA